MRLRCQISTVLFVLLTSQLAAGVSLVGQIGRLFLGDSATQVSVGSIAILVADTDKNSHPGLVNPLGTTLSLGNSLAGGSGDLIVGIYSTSDLGDGIVGVDLGGTTLSYGGSFTAGTDLWLVWFPSLSSLGSRVGGAIPYGTYRSSLVDTSSGSDIAFVAPADGATASLYAYTMSLGFGLASNPDLSATSVTSQDRSGSYFGVIGTGGGHWALNVKFDGTATYIAYLPDRNSAIVVHLTVDAMGSFSSNGSEIVALSNGNNRSSARSIPSEGSTHGLVISTSFTLTGQISGSTVNGQLSGLGISFTGESDITGSTTAGFYTASALGMTSGTTYAIVGPSGQTVVVTTTATSVDGASGTVNNNGQLSATTTGGAQLSLSVNGPSQSVDATITPAGSAAPISFAGLSDSVVNTSRLVNVASRAYCSTGNNVTIGGFVIAGTGTKRVLVRAVGPSLISQGIGQTEVLLDPTIEVHQGASVIASNDNWGTNANTVEIASVSAQIGARALDSGDMNSSALLLTLSPGVYSFVVSGKASSSGIVLLEIFDADLGTPTAEFVNIATRAYATTGNGVTIGGFVIAGNAPKRVLLRGVGPTLLTQGISQSEVLVDPMIELHKGAPTISSNDNSADNPNFAELGTTGARIGAMPLADMDTKSSALLVTLQPGAYSFVASGKASASGVVLVEIYDAD